MLDASEIIDSIVAALQTNADLTALLANQDPSSIIPYYDDDPKGSNFEQRTQELADGFVLVAWRGTRTGNFNKLEVIKHDFTCYLTPIGRATTVFAAFMNGVCVTASGTQKFRLSTIHPKCNPPEAISLVPQPFLVAQAYGIYDMHPVSFTLTERGVDV